MQHRLFSTSILVILSVTLVFLGIRPAFAKSDLLHPKPRPRAVLESQVKSEECGKKQLDVAAVAEPVAAAALAATKVEPTVFLEKAVPTLSLFIAAAVNSRASPDPLA